MSFRTRTCGELTLADIGKNVKVCGFVETIRDLGGLVFLDIRDMYGITQAVTSGKEDIETRFSALFNAFQFGAPPHAGIAPGIDRMLMLLTESETIRDVIAFPMNSKAEDLLMGAPGKVTKEQLKDVHIKLDV